MTTLRVADDAAGTRLDRYLASLPAIGSRAAAERILASGPVLVDGRARPKSHRLEGGEELEFELPDQEPVSLAPEQRDFAIRFEDEHLLVVDKPAGVVVHPAPGHTRGTLVHGLLAAGAEGGDDDRPGIVHRLDRDTSGLLVVARSDEAHARLQELIRERAVTREYLALVVGRPRSRRGTIDAPIGRDRHDRLRHSLDTDSPRAAVTHFEVEELLPAHALLRVRLETGRTHQIRVHLAAIEIPVAGDPLYGRPGELGLERQFLHARRLVFPHPFGGEEVEVDSPLPDDLAAALDALRTPTH
ncbi:MAG TPA: RluA family pseudouridine synthase [Gaiellaceae bacterium]|nr:RluA family pseudouridine synthase [Gaiellaceae bacterium]